MQRRRLLFGAVGVLQFFGQQFANFRFHESSFSIRIPMVREHPVEQDPDIWPPEPREGRDFTLCC